MARVKAKTKDGLCYLCKRDKYNTPTWRKGPHGRNTLCNSCGLKYTSGMLRLGELHNYRITEIRLWILRQQYTNTYKQYSINAQ